MTRHVFVGALGVLCLAGCCSQKNVVSDKGKQAHDEVVMSESAVFREIPMNVEIGKPSLRADGKYSFEIVVTVDNPVSAVPMLAITPDNGTLGADSAAEYPLEELKDGGVASRVVTLASKAPSFKASVRLIGQGYGYEVHAFYPPRESQRVDDGRRLLPQPVENRGIRINSAVEVKPEVKP